MITKDFKDLTDKIIKGLEEKKFLTGNGNVLIAKPPVEEKRGSILLPEMVRELEAKKKGFGRILSVPINLSPDTGDLPLKAGDYAFYTYVAESPVNRLQLGEIIGVSIPEEMLTHTQDAEVILLVGAEMVHGEA